MSVITSIAGSLLSSACAEAKIASLGKKKDIIKLNFSVALIANKVTSKSAVIHVYVSGIDKDIVGKDKTLYMVMHISGHGKNGSISIPIVWPVKRSEYDHFDHDEELSRDTLRDNAGNPSDLPSDTEFQVFLGYAVLPANMKIREYREPIEQIALLPFKTLPEENKEVKQ